MELINLYTLSDPSNKAHLEIVFNVLNKKCGLILTL